ncbi:hypothetical protein [uncultured Mailhella sp.]|uniref:hypothetical protein n=1 Tax=uncultured Mailhella sp. TaxID=1981031 RepID=UPI00260C22CC|nr:hypothetical protein [uncultured Mailhella sp.]
MGVGPAAGSEETAPTGWQPAKEFDKFRKHGYLEDEASKITRIADILEKFAVGSLLVGLYQQQALAVIPGVAGLIACLHVTRRMQ